jgi:serine/threonine protein kinase
VIHRDLKPENVLLGKQGELKICDFGLARRIALGGDLYTREVCCIWYRPPELMVATGSTHATYGESLDVWAIGMILVELIMGECPFRGDSELDQLHKILKVMGTPDDVRFANMPRYADAPGLERRLLQAGGEREAVNLTLGLLRVLPEERMQLVDAVKHAFFDSIPAKIRKLCAL